MRTFSRSDWLEAQRRWKDGEFSDAWLDIRSLAARSGIIFPPDGTKWDSWEDEFPSQRALLYRAIVDMPAALRVAIVGSRSWNQVLTKLLLTRDAMRADADRELEEDRQRRAAEPSRRAALQSIRQIVRRTE